MHTPRYIYREGKGIFRREDLRRTLREAAASNVASRIRDSRGDARGSQFLTLSYGSCTHVKVRRIPFCSIYRRRRVKNLRRCANIQRGHGGRIFPSTHVAGFTVHFRRTSIRPARARAKEHNPSMAEGREASRAGCELSFPAHTGFRQSARPLR